MEVQTQIKPDLLESDTRRCTLLIRGTGEMADRIRSHDWALTELDPIHAWPPELPVLVNMMLSSREIATVFWGPDRLMIYNDHYTTQLGERHPALGRPLRDVWPEVVDQITSLVEPVFEHGQSTYLDDSPLMVLEHGIETERFYTAFFEPIWVRQGDALTVCGIYQTATNNTPRIQMQRRLRASESETREAQLAVDRADKQLALVLEAADLATWFYDPEQGIIGGDRKMAELFNFPEAVGPADQWISKIHPEDRERVSAEFAAALRGEPYDTTYRIVDGDSVRWIKARARDLDGDGQRRIIGLCEDITRLKNTEAAVLRNEKLAAVGRLASSISHEINNPLESVTNLLFLISTSSDLDSVREYTEIAERELRRVSLIANQTLRFHRQSTRPALFFCQDLIGDSLSLFQGRLVNSKIEIEKRKRAQQAVNCFGGDIRQVLSNLIGNAINAMPFGGRLILRSREATRWKTGEKGIVLTVAGIGMSAAVQQKIFEPFFSTNGIGGTGLGLWVSCEIVTRHRATLRVRSSQVPKHTGSVFTLFLPFSPAPVTGL